MAVQATPLSARQGSITETLILEQPLPSNQHLVLHSHDSEAFNTALNTFKPSEVTAPLVQGIIDALPNVPADAPLDQLVNRALMLLGEEGGTNELEWKPRTLLGKLVCDVVKARPQLRVSVSQKLRGIVESNMDKQRTRDEYYQTYVTPATQDLGMLPTEGWGSLEIALSALSQLYDGNDSEADRDALLSFAARAQHHANRYVRQVGFTALGTVAAKTPPSMKPHTHTLFLNQKVAEALAAGLCDTWAQVRYSAALAARDLLDMCPGIRDRSWLNPLLCPLFVSRHDFAEGVRRLAHTNWRRAVNVSGKTLLARNAAAVAALLCSQQMAETHEKRVATCNAIGELASAVSRDAVEPHTKKLLDVLLAGICDQHWSVRLAACNALHDFVGVFPDSIQTSPDAIPESVHTLLRLLGDEISGVREAAAAVLGAYARTWSCRSTLTTIRNILLAATKDNLERIKLEPLPLGFTRDSIFTEQDKTRHDNDVALHTSQQSYGCCMLERHDEHPTHQEEQPWRWTDGGVHLLREVSKLYPADTAAFLPLLDEAARCRWFAHQQTLQHSIMQQLPKILAALGPLSSQYRNLELLHPHASGTSCELKP